MKKILFITKINGIAKDINDYLSRFFQIQICSENVEVVKSMIQMCNPPLLLICLTGFTENEKNLFNNIGIHYADIPTVVIGTESELAKYKDYYLEDQFFTLIRPTRNSALLELICDKLLLDYNEIVNAANEEKDEKLHLLFVDDDVMELRRIRKILEDDYKVSVAASGAQAMTFLGKCKPDMIFLDYEMPVCDGRMTLEMIRSEEELRGIPVVFLTGMAERKYIEAVLSLNPAAYLLKPASREKIVLCIRDWESKQHKK